MSMSINSYSTMSNKKGIGGLASGLNTDEIIEQMTSGTRQKITSQLQNRQIAIWKRDAYREITSKMMAFNNKYFSYSTSASKDNILSKEYFNTAKANSSSSNVSISGNADAAKNMQIKDIKQLASKTGFTTNHQVSNQKMDSGVIYDTWKQDTVAGQSIKISYGGKEHTLTADSNFYLNSHDVPGTQINAVISELNSQIGKNADLKGKLEFSFDSIHNKVTLNQIGTNNTDDLRLEGGNINLLTGLGLYASPKAAEGMPAPVFSQIEGTDAVREGAFFENNLLASSAITLEINGNLNVLSLESDFRFSAAAMNDEVKMREELQNAYNTAISKKDTLKDVLKVTVNTDNTLSLEVTQAQDGKQTLKVLGGNSTLLEGLGLKVTQESDPVGISITGTALQKDKILHAPDKLLSEVLSGSVLTVNLNGISKKITFKESEKAEYEDPAKLAVYLQKSLNSAYGENRTFVTETGGKLTFSTTVKDASGNVIKGDPSAIFTIHNSDILGVMGEHGALKIMVGESNRAEYIKTLDQIKGDLSTTLVAGTGDTYNDKYAVQVNGKEFIFDKDTMLGDVISKINADPDSGVVISYSSITDVFNVSAKASGSSGKVEITDVAGNLAETLFGKSNVDYTVEQGNDLEMLMSFDSGKTFTTVKRSENMFSIDGVNLEIKGMAEGAIEENITFTADSNTNDLFDKIKGFIDEYNQVIDAMNTKITEKRYGVDLDSTEVYLPLTDEQKKEMSDSDIKIWEEKAKLGLLRNDQTLYRILNDFRRATGNGVGSAKDALYQVGIATKPYAYEENGKLYIDEDKLKKALTEDSQKVIRIFTDQNDGVSSRMKKVLDFSVGLSGSGGILLQIAGREKTIAPDQSVISRDIKGITKQLDTLKSRLQVEEKRYWARFTQLEKYISAMNQQSSWLTQQFSV